MNPDSTPPQEPAHQTVPQVSPQTTPHYARIKTIAVLMAVFLGVFSWLYTYARDKKKFWVSIIIALGLYVAAKVTGVLAVWITYYVCSLVIYIWVIVDTAKKPGAYFTYYPSYQPNGPGSVSTQPQQPLPAQFEDKDAYQTFMPTKNKFALKSYYYGCIGIIPLIGLPFSIFAVTNGRKALEQYKANPTPGAKAHAKVGIGLGIVELIFFALISIALVDFIVR